MKIGGFSTTAEGYESLVLHAAIAEDFAPYLDPAVPFVWILDHAPRSTGGWWQTEVPLNDLGFSAAVQVRNIVYDLMLSTSDFLRNIHEFNGAGLLLIQADRPMPDSLVLHRIPEDQQSRVLIQNGATLKIYLPHAVETATIVSYRPGFLASRGVA